MLGKAIAMSGMAALVDHRAPPKRFTLGWELVLTLKAMVGVYLAIAARFAAAALRPG